jgi:hypothetical protein
MPSGPPPSGPRLRASDADRLVTVRALQDAVARGLVTPDEGSERMAAAFAAVHREDLGPLTADLPPAPPETVAAPGWRALATMAVEQVRFSLSAAANGRLDPVRVAAAAVVALVLLGIVGFVVGDLLVDGGGRGGGGFDRFDG